jgi:glycosyltransferase involved in cell wall biosynthesis
MNKPYRRERIVYATYVSPFPTHSGERIRALNLIAALLSLGYEVEAIVGNYDGVDLKAHNRHGVGFHQIPFAWPRLRQAAAIYFRPHQSFVEQVAALNRARPVVAVFLDYGFMGAQIAPLAALGVPIILGTHNLESALTGQAPQDLIGATLAIRLRQAIECAHERWFFRQADAVICVSEEDLAAYRRFVPANRLHVVPNFIDVPDVYSDARRENRIVMTGSFGNFQNVHGLRWFVDEVFDDELRAAASLCVAGHLSDKAVERFAGVPGIVGLGSRQDLLPEVASSRCAVVPLWRGGGTRLKCLEAMAARTPVVTTTKGCEGITHEDTFRVADSARAFKGAILDLLRNPGPAAAAAARARAVFDRRYSLAANAALLAEVIASAAEGHGRGRIPA